MTDGAVDRRRPTTGTATEVVIPAHPVAVNHPDRTTSWVIVLVARAAAGGAVVQPSLIQSRLSDLRTTTPLVGARLRGSAWHGGDPPRAQLIEGIVDPLTVLPLHRFDLTAEAPLRVVGAADGTWLALCAHHFAFDGLGMIALMRGLLTGEREVVSTYRASSVSSRSEIPWPLFRRVMLPADPVAASSPVPPSEVLLTRAVELGGKQVTSKLAAACTKAAIAHNRRCGAPVRRIGISVAVGGVDGDSATYRRIDVRPNAPIRQAVERALSTSEVPRELVALPRAARLLSPVLGRLSDTILVSNLGRPAVGNVASLDFFPVARGRSAVALGAVSILGGRSTLTLRARFLDPSDAQLLLDGAVAALGRELAS